MKVSLIRLKTLLLWLLTILSQATIVSAQMKDPFTLEVAKKKEQSEWKRVPELLAGIRPPAFSVKKYNVLSFSARAGGISDCRYAFNKAIFTCSSAGGGVVEVPPGKYLINGPIHLLSDVNLHLREGAELVFGTNPSSYLPVVKVRWEGVVCYNYSPLIYAIGQKNIALTGAGIIDGRTPGTWSLWKKDNGGRNQDQDKLMLRKMGNDGIPERQRIFGDSHFLRPDLIQLYECENILLDSVTLKNSPFWTVHPVFCKNVTIRNVTIKKGTTNDDGIDPESCSGVLIENCHISTNDDAISIKAGRDQDAWGRTGTQNVVVRNCVLNSEIANAFCIGSEMSGGVQNVFLEKCRSYSADNGVNFKCNLDRGGFIKNVFIRKFDLDTCRSQVILFQMDYHGYRGGSYPPDFSGFFLSDITSRHALSKNIRIAGVKDKPVGRVLLRQIEISGAEEPMEISFANEVLTENVDFNNKPK